MPAIKHAVLLTMSVLGAYLYLQVPLLRPYSLQFFALITLLYLILQRRLSQGDFVLLPQAASANLALINLAFLLLVGSSGTLDSPFFALTFIQLFFLILSAESKTSLLIALEIMVFHFSLKAANMQGYDFSTSDWSNLLAIPIVTIFYLFGKIQYQRAYYRSLLLDAEARELWKARSDDQAVEEFVDSLLNKRLPMFEFLLSFPEKNSRQLNAEMKVLKGDLNKLLRSMQKKNLPKNQLEKELAEIIDQDEQENEN